MTDDEKILAVARANALHSRVVDKTLDQVIEAADSRISESKEVLSRYGKTEIESRTARPLLSSPLVIRSFDQLVAEAGVADASPATIEDLLAPAEIGSVESRLDSMREDFRRLHRMDGIDYAIAGCAGLVGALVDIFLVQMPQAPGLLGGPRTSGGPLANWLRDRMNSTVPPERLSWLEREFKVPYDASISTNLTQKIEGLSPRTHRFHSLGHDPLLGFIFGVGDIMSSKMSAIDKSGNFISQAVGVGSDASNLGASLFSGLYRMLGHLLSDVTTKAGLPAPLMSLCLLAQSKLTILGDRSPAEISRAMYAKNYDFRHFVAMGVTPLLIECIVRIGYFWKAVASGKEWLEALPIQSLSGARKPRLHSMLFTAHAIAASANAGKMAVQGGLSPVGLLSLNYPQWLALGRYAVSQAIWIGYSKPKAELAHVQSVLDVEWTAFYGNTDRLFAESSKSAFVIHAD